MVNTKQSNLEGNHTTQQEPSSNGNISNRKPLQDTSSTIDNARPDLNSPPANNNHVPDMNEGGENLVATGAGTLGGAAVGAIAGNDIAQADNKKDDKAVHVYSGRKLNLL